MLPGRGRSAQRPVAVRRARHGWRWHRRLLRPDALVGRAPHRGAGRAAGAGRQHPGHADRPAGTPAPRPPPVASADGRRRRPGAVGHVGLPQHPRDGLRDGLRRPAGAAHGRSGPAQRRPDRGARRRGHCPVATPVGSFFGLLLLCVACWRSGLVPRPPLVLLAAFLVWDFLLPAVGVLEPHLLLWSRGGGSVSTSSGCAHATGAATHTDPMSGRMAAAAPLLAWLAGAVTLACAATAGLLGTAGSDGLSWKRLVLSAVWVLPGALVAAGRPRIAVGWLLLGVGLLFATSGLADQWVAREGAAGPGAAWAIWWSDRFSGLLVVLMCLALLLLPDGRLPTRRWHPPVVVLVAVQVATVLAWSLASGPAAAPGSDWPDGADDLANPVGVLPTAVGEAVAVRTWWSCRCRCCWPCSPSRPAPAGASRRSGPAWSASCSPPVCSRSSWWSAVCSGRPRPTCSTSPRARCWLRC